MVDMSNISEVVEVVSGISPELAKRAGYLIFILQAAGIILIIYLLYLLINGFFNWRRNRRINKMYYMVKELDAKIELIIGKMLEEDGDVL